MQELKFHWQIPQTPLLTASDAGTGILREELRRSMTIILTQLLNEVTFNTPVDTGRLRAELDKEIILGQGANITGVVFSGTEYAPYVEEGAPPHMPPVDALKGWVNRVFQLGGNEKLIERAAWAVALAIKRRGTKAHRMFAKGWQQVEPIVDIFLDDALEVARQRMEKAR